MKTALDTFREAKTPDMCQWMLACQNPATTTRQAPVGIGNCEVTWMDIACCKSCAQIGR